MRERLSFKVASTDIFGFILAISFANFVPVLSKYGFKSLFGIVILISLLCHIRNRNRFGLYSIVTLILFCLINIYSNLIHHGDTSWTGMQLHIISVILFVYLCYKKNTIRPIYVFVCACDLWVIVSFFDVLVKIQSPNQTVRQTMILCGYDNGLGGYFLPTIAMNLFFIMNHYKNPLLRIGVFLAALQVFLVWSATAMVGVVLIVGLFYFLHFKKKKSRLFSPGLIFILTWVVFVFVIVLRIYDISIVRWLVEKVLHRDMTFTTRTNVWDSSFAYILRSPIIGNGRLAEYQRTIFHNVSSAHNCYLDVLCQSGIVGLTVFVLALISIPFKRYTEDIGQQYLLCAAFLMMLVMQFESYCAYPGYPLLYFLLVFAKFSPKFMESGVETAQESEAAQRSKKFPFEKKLGIQFVWKPPIWLEEDDGKATGIREENVSFGVFGTLICRSVARPADLFRIMEQNDPRVPEHFAEKRIEAEQAARAKLGARMGLADIYEELLPLYGAHTNDLMALEIQYEIAGCRPVAENIDLVNLCMEHDKNVFLLADTYLPSSVLRRMLDVCGVYHYDRLYVSCEEGACKADGSLFWKVLADQEIRPHELRHIGSDLQGDITEPWRVGVHVKRGMKKGQSAVDKELPEEMAWYERTLQTCIRNCADGLDSDDARLGCETFGPLLAGFTAWLREQLRRDGIQDVYFLAGDGSVLKQAFDALEDGGFRTHSLYFPEKTAEQDHEALVAYLLACGMQGRVALVDTGRQIIVQKTLENLIAEAGLNIQIKGYYVGLTDTNGMQAAGYLYEQGQGKETLEKLSPIMAIFDTVFHAQHGAVRRIAIRDGQPVPELDDYEYASDEGRICDEIAILRAYQAGALTLVREMNEAFPGGVPQIPGEAAILPLLRMGTNPTRQEAELWGDFRVFKDGKATLMARPRGKGSYLLHPGQLKRDYAASPWKIGFLRRLVRLPLAYDKIVKNR